jgi:hypothetical protein
MVTDTDKKLEEGLAMARCTQANIENLSKAVPGLLNVPMFKIVQLQISQTIKALTGEFDDG